MFIFTRGAPSGARNKQPTRGPTKTLVYNAGILTSSALTCSPPTLPPDGGSGSTPHPDPKSPRPRQATTALAASASRPHPDRLTTLDGGWPPRVLGPTPVQTGAAAGIGRQRRQAQSTRTL